MQLQPKDFHACAPRMLTKKKTENKCIVYFDERPFESSSLVDRGDQRQKFRDQSD